MAGLFVFPGNDDESYWRVRGDGALRRGRYGSLKKQKKNLFALSSVNGQRVMCARCFLIGLFFNQKKTPFCLAVSCTKRQFSNGLFFSFSENSKFFFKFLGTPKPSQKKKQIFSKKKKNTGKNYALHLQCEFFRDFFFFIKFGL